MRGAARTLNVHRNLVLSARDERFWRRARRAPIGAPRAARRAARTAPPTLYGHSGNILLLTKYFKIYYQLVPNYLVYLKVKILINLPFKK